METAVNESQLALQLSPFTTAISTANFNIESEARKAWHIFGLILSLGRPASPAELASKCDLFDATPDFIEFLCGLPDSPLHLKRDSYVTISSVGYNGIARFFSNADVNLRFSPQLGFEFEVLEPRRVCGDENPLRTYYRKRKRLKLDNELLQSMKRSLFEEFCENEETRSAMQLPSGDESTSAQAYFVDDCLFRSFNMMSSNPLLMTSDFKIENGINTGKDLTVIQSARHLSRRCKTITHEKENDIHMCFNGEKIGCARDLDTDGFSYISEPINVNRPLHLKCSQEALPLAWGIKTPVVRTEAEVDNDRYNGVNFISKSCLLGGQTVDHDQGFISKSCLLGGQTVDHTQGGTDIHCCEAQLGDWEMVEECERWLMDDCDRQMPIAIQPDKIAHGNAEEKMKMKIDNTLLSLYEEKPKTPIKSQATIAASMFTVGPKHLGKSLAKPRIVPKDEKSCKPRVVCRLGEKNKVINTAIDQQQFRREKKVISTKQKYICDENKNSEEKQERYRENREKPVSANNQEVQNEFPTFESYIVEEEEGSGGYGTVYRARRKLDGLAFAIKCPHANASRYHVQNEVKMLERFGGKNFVIKYEGSFKGEKYDCLVLEHVEHDRPEVLKREIDVSQLQWYGFCMFKALAALHKQGIIHRDVKPGNFLFSRKTNKGYLIDFNLAVDLHQKYGITERTRSGSDSSFNHVSISNSQPLPPMRNKKYLTMKDLDLMNLEAPKVSKSNLFPKNLKRKTNHAKDYTNNVTTNVIKSQGADGSGITSAKDATSNRTPSAERLREPIPLRGRKELLSLVQEALHGTDHQAVNVPASKRKRVAAPPGKVDRKCFHLTPMPLHSLGIPVAGAGLLKNKGDGKQKVEGPCAGTKGFRAPEVLVRSVHQGPKVDIWSAGVTLLYLMIGRTPFAGDPDQNIKEIAKLRGTEDLWEVAKLHNRESSFPADLFDTKFLPSVRLREWCKQQTRRPDFCSDIPESLLDLVDKCLTVNPRLRISAEEALSHEFFTPCHDVLKKHRQQRQVISLDSGTTLSLGKQAEITGQNRLTTLSH